MGNEFEGTNGMGDLFYRVALPMCKIIHGIDAPVIPRAMMMGMFDPVHDRVAHMHVGRAHVDLRPQYFLPVPVFSRTHLFEQTQVLFDAAVTERAALTGLCRRPFQCRDLL